MSECNIMPYINNLPFSSWLIMSNISSVLIAIRQFFNWIALGDVDVCFSLMLIQIANAVGKRTGSAT